MLNSKNISRRTFGEKVGKVSFATLTTSAIVAILSSCSGDDEKVSKKPDKNDNSRLSIDLNEMPALQKLGGYETFKVDDKPVILIHTGEHTFQSFSLVCTHKGCTVSWKSNSEKFACPCHGSQFNHKGEVTSGPAENALTEYKTTYKDKGIVVIEFEGKKLTA
ncbi:Rieske 2Fe-2S domain-containing protein [candidate division KSB1 bacterium]|nr:Rieske 2Fe-2S domain-containing protein [candidate division KSB1 bacterium]